MQHSQPPTRADVLDVVSRSFLASVAPGALSQILDHAVMFRARPGEIFIQQDDAHRPALLITGLARAFIVLPDGREHTVRDITPGSVAGITLLPHATSPVNVQAVLESHLLELDSSALVDLAHRDSTVAMASAQEAVQRLHDVLVVMAVDAGGIRQRLARRLLEMSIEAQDRPIGVTHQVLAHQLGCSREWVSRTIRVLRQDGLVVSMREGIMVTDRVRLSLISNAWQAFGSMRDAQSESLGPS